MDTRKKNSKSKYLKMVATNESKEKIKKNIKNNGVKSEI